MQIFIKTLTGRKTNFNFELDNTVRQVKEALQEKEGIQVEQIRLIYSGKQMSDECTLSDYNVKPGSTIHMVLQLRLSVCESCRSHWNLAGPPRSGQTNAVV